jgi:ferric-dicitrate binding protein FerR (iron transport regulator)
MATEDRHSEFDRMLVSYLSGELSPEESASFREELDKDPQKQELLESYRRIWDGAVTQESYDLDAEWTLLKRRIPDLDAKTGRSLRFYTYRIAAVLVLGLLLGISWVYLNRMKDMVRVLAEDQPVEVNLEDGTRVWLNRNSSFRYSRSFDLEERRVYLSGEAWFDVARDTSMPFVVDAGAALVEVLGTSFNVNAYKKNPMVEITVESGLVALSSKSDQQEQIVMKAGSGGTYNKARKELKLTNSSDPNSISWMTRELVFNGSSLREVCELISKVYGVHMEVLNQELASCPITVTFSDQSLESVLRVLELTLDLQISRDGDEIILDGEGCVE